VGPVTELSWRTALDEGEAAEVVALATAATEADGTEPLGEHVLLHLRDAAAAHLLARDASGALVGVAQLDMGEGEGSAELVVHPAHRMAGLGRRVVEALLERTAGVQLRVWAHGQLPGAVALAARLGFRNARELWQMERGLEDPLPAPELAEGVRLRTFVEGVDEAEFLRVNNAAFAWHPEQGGWTLADVRLREGEPWFDATGFVLAVDPQDRLLGFHWTKVHAGDEPVGEVYVVGVDPGARGMRLGTALTVAGLRYLQERGLRRVILYVEADNDPAVRLYRDLGFTLRHSDVSYLR
jgi:mycothiol synthase